MEGGEVVYLTGRKLGPQAKEYAVLFRLAGGEAQFKVFGEGLGKKDKDDLAAAFESAATVLRGSAKRSD